MPVATTRPTTVVTTTVTPTPIPTDEGGGIRVDPLNDDPMG